MTSTCATQTASTGPVNVSAGVFQMAQTMDLVARSLLSMTFAQMRHRLEVETEARCKRARNAMEEAWIVKHDHLAGKVGEVYNAIGFLKGCWVVERENMKESMKSMSQHLEEMLNKHCRDIELEANQKLKEMSLELCLKLDAIEQNTTNLRADQSSGIAETNTKEGKSNGGGPINKSHKALEQKQKQIDEDMIESLKRIADIEQKIKVLETSYEKQRKKSEEKFNNKWKDVDTKQRNANSKLNELQNLVERNIKDINVVLQRNTKQLEGIQEKQMEYEENHRLLMCEVKNISMNVSNLETFMKISEVANLNKCKQIDGNLNKKLEDLETAMSTEFIKVKLMEDKIVDAIRKFENQYELTQNEGKRYSGSNRIALLNSFLKGLPVQREEKKLVVSDDGGKQIRNIEDEMERSVDSERKVHEATSISMFFKPIPVVKQSIPDHINEPSTQSSKQNDKQGISMTNPSSSIMIPGNPVPILTNSTPTVFKCLDQNSPPQIKADIAPPPKPSNVIEIGNESAPPPTAQDLWLAAKHGNTKKVRKLLASGANIHAQDRNQTCAIHLASMWGHTDTVALLLDKGADVNAASKILMTPLHLAAMYNHVECVALLARRGGNTENEDTCGNTPLHFAVLRGQMKAVEALLEAGSDIGAQNKNKKTPVCLAISSKMKRLLTHRKKSKVT